MALTNQQYESIMRGYEKLQLESRRLWERRRDEVYDRIPGYRELDDAAGSVSVAHARRLLSGEEDRPGELRRELACLADARRKLLTDAGFPDNYLDPVYHCADCKDTGYLNGQKCHCFRSQETALLYEQCNIQEIIRKENFSTLSEDYYSGEDLNRFRSAAELSRAFAANFKEERRNLFFYGTVGTGKSFLSGCIAGELLKEGFSVIYFSASGLFDTLARYSFDSKNKENLYNFYKDLYNCDLVIIDDLGTEVTNSFVTSQLFACLNERHLRGKSVIISTNLNLEELRDRYSDRIFSRITSHFTICKLSGPDIRMLKKRMAISRR